MPCDKNSFTVQFTSFKSPWLGRFTFSSPLAALRDSFNLSPALQLAVIYANRVKGLCQSKVLLTKLLKL